MIKNATVSARIDENVKNEAESILQQLGIPVSVVINTLYHQIIIKKGVPFPMTLNIQPSTLDEMTYENLDARLQHSYAQAKRREGKPANDVFAELEKKHLKNNSSAITQ